MALFEGKLDRSDFDKYKRANETRLAALDSAIKAKTSDYEAAASAAAAAAVKSQEQANSTAKKIEEALADIHKHSAATQAELQTVSGRKAEILEAVAQLKAKIDSAMTEHQGLLDLKAQATTATQETLESVNKVKALIDQAAALPQAVANTQALVKDATQKGEALDGLLNTSLKKTNDLDALHKKVLGQDIKDDNGETTHIDGLRDELESAFDGLSEKLETLDATIFKKTDAIEKKHDGLLGAKREQYDSLVSGSKQKITEIEEELRGLLPGGLAAGLSAAYEAKKDEELRSLYKYERNFFLAICGLVLVSLIPFGVDIYLLAWKGADLVQVIKDTPSLLLRVEN